MKSSLMFLLMALSSFIFAAELSDVGSTIVCNILRQKDGLQKVETWSGGGCRIATSAELANNQAELTFYIPETYACYYHIIVDVKLNKIMGQIKKSPINECEQVWDEVLKK